MNTPEHTIKVQREINYQLAIHIVYQIARDGLLAVMLDRGDHDGGDHRIRPVQRSVAGGLR